MPEKMTIAGGSGYRASLTRSGEVAGFESRRLCGARREREQRVEDLGQLAERRVGQSALRVQDPGDAAQQVAEQVARALDGVDAQLDLVGADDEAEHIEVD